MGTRIILKPYMIALLEKTELQIDFLQTGSNFVAR